MNAILITALAWCIGLWAAPSLDAPDSGVHAPASASAPVVPAMNATISGRVTDQATGRPLEGVQVTVEPGSYGALSNANGRYVIRIEDTSLRGTRVTLRAQRIGYASEEREVDLSGTAVVVDVALSPVGLEMQELVVTGDGESKLLQGREAPRASYQTPGPGPDSMASARRVRRHSLRGTESYATIVENVFLTARDEPLSTFSIDVDRASYANVRRFLSNGHRPPRDAVRIEELINYFSYDYPDPRGAHPFEIHTDIGPAPWNERHRLVRIGLQGKRIDLEDAPPANLVFLIDVSGSMRPENKLPLLKRAFRMLVEELRPQDRVAMVVYAGAAGLVLPSTPGHRKTEILRSIESLEAGGSTAGGAGIRLAYDIASEHFIEGGNNRVVLATDGDFNVGPSSDADMIHLIERRRRDGVFLTVLGFGMGNLKDSKMEALADHGNGNYAYIDSKNEARKVLVTELGGTLITIAKDVKIQVEFNPARVEAYRLIGYENRLLAAEDFNDDTKDAGELGAGHTVTALYEVVPKGAGWLGDRSVDPLRYQRPTDPEDDAPALDSRATDSEELLFVKLRYKDPDGRRSRLIERPVLDRVDDPSTDLRFAAAVAAFGMILRDSEHCGDFTLRDVARLAGGSLGEDREGYRREFLNLVELARDHRVMAERLH